MLGSIGSFFQKHLGSDGMRSEETTRHQAQLAAAALLIEVVQADQQVTPAERQLLLDSVKGKFELSEQEATELMELAERQARDATDLHQFTLQINRQFSAEQKLRLLEALWRVAYADSILHRHEEHLIRKIADLIHVPHAAFIAAKLRAQERQL